MATIANIIRDRRGRAGARGAWEVRTVPGHGLPKYELRHYDWLMLTWYDDPESGPVAAHVDTGHGSVSDQGGMNIAFKVLGLPYYFSRAGGADIRRVDR